jgi:tetratricopeptide (TPR) repeat protein
MEEKRVLVACLKAVAIVLIGLTAASCSFPRIAVLHDPLSPEEHVNLGVSYEKRGELDAALKEYKTASKKLPLAHLYIGNVYFRQKNYTKAKKSYKAVIEKNGPAEAYNNLAWLYYITDTHLDVAEELARKAVTLSPDTQDFRDTLQKIQDKRQR